MRLRTIANPHPTRTGFWGQPEPPSHGDAGNPRGSYFLASDDRPVAENSPRWRMPLPLSPAGSVKSGEPAAGAAVTYGDYFTAVHRILEGDRFAALTGAVRKCLGKSVTAADLGTVRIYLEKHGQFYHPARVAVAVANTRLAFVVNVAVTKIGRSYLREDFGNIRLLNDRFPYRFLPQVYCTGEATLPGRSRRLEMFLGEWLDGYHEFHLSGEPAGTNSRLVVWDPVKGAHPLSKQQRVDIYRQIALILTAYYDLETFEQIFSWHNAAGDFIVKTDGGQIDLRLITVRKYAPLFADVSGDVDTTLQALLIFWLNLSIRIRLDRFDGVGEFGCADDDMVDAALNGFFDGLALQVRFGRIPKELPDLFAGYLKALAPDDRDTLLEGVAGRLKCHPSEKALIRKHLKRHGEKMTQAIDRLPQELIVSTR
ncbi:MAG: hypothetical protein ABF303_09150 [Desulfobacterales bacterium]